MEKMKRGLDMKMKKLEEFFSPKSIAVVGASNDKKKVGYGVFRNIITSSFKGDVYAVNQKRKIIQGKKSYLSVKEIQKEVDIVIIATPANTVPIILKECGEKKVKGAVIMSSGFMEAGKHGEDLTKSIVELSKKYEIRIMGPNCMGFMRPSINLNASFAKKSPKPGNIAFISQSGALGSSTLDWALKNELGFSFFASLGSMIDISFDDIINFLSNDKDTESIVIYMESLKNAKDFMNVARDFSLNKPIILLKAGKSNEGKKAALSHTGNLTGDDEVFDAVFKKVGIVRVDNIDNLFDCAKTLSKQKRPKGNRLAIITNAGGPGVVSTDLLIKKGGELARLDNQSILKLSKFLPNNWSHSNPVDLLGDAKEEDYKRAIKVCLNDKNVDGILILLTPQTMTDPLKIAKSIISIKSNKLILASFMGGETVAQSKELLEKNNIPTFPFPERAVMSFIYLSRYHKNIKSLSKKLHGVSPRFEHETERNKNIIREVTSQKRYSLTEAESKEFLENYKIPVIKQVVCKSKKDAVEGAKKIGFPVVMKVFSSEIIHKTDVGGVKLNIKSEKEVEDSFDIIIKNIKKHHPNLNIKEVIISPMVNKKYELIIGSKKDLIFGPTIVFGMGGVAVNIFRDFQVGIPPLSMHSSEMLIKNTKVYNLLKGYRGAKSIDLKELQFILYKFSVLVSDFLEIKEIDINPFCIDEDGGVVVDSKIILDEEYIRSKKDNAKSYII
jgi:acetyltransferase